MATRLIGTDDANPRLPAVVIAATQGNTADDLAPGTVLADANAYTDAAVAAGGGGSGGGVEVFVYIDETDARPDADVVFWIPDPYTLGDPFGALPGDLVLRTTPDVVQGLNGITGLWKGTAAEYEALATHDDSTVYFVIAPP